MASGKTAKEGRDNGGEKEVELSKRGDVSSTIPTPEDNEFETKQLTISKSVPSSTEKGVTVSKGKNEGPMSKAKTFQSKSNLKTVDKTANSTSKATTNGNLVTVRPPNSSYVIRVPSLENSSLGIGFKERLADSKVMIAFISETSPIKGQVNVGDVVLFVGSYDLSGRPFKKAFDLVAAFAKRRDPFMMVCRTGPHPTTAVMAKSALRNSSRQTATTRKSPAKKKCKNSDPKGAKSNEAKQKERGEIMCIPFSPDEYAISIPPFFDSPLGIRLKLVEKTFVVVSVCDTSPIKKHVSPGVVLLNINTAATTGLDYDSVISMFQNLRNRNMASVIVFSSPLARSMDFSSRTLANSDPVNAEKEPANIGGASKQSTSEKDINDSMPPRNGGIDTVIRTPVSGSNYAIIIPPFSPTLGISLESIKGQYYTITKFADNSPMKNHCQVGDSVLFVDGTPTAGMTASVIRAKFASMRNEAYPTALLLKSIHPSAATTLSNGKASSSKQTDCKEMSSDHYHKFFSELEPRYFQIVEFFKTHKHCEVPSDCKEFPGLFQWCKQLREIMSLGLKNCVPKEIDTTRVKDIIGLGFDFDVDVNKRKARLEKKEWAKMYAALDQFCKKNGHCKVPYSEPLLWAWINDQMNKCVLDQLPRKRYEQLQSLGVDFSYGSGWSLDKISEEIWNLHYEELEEHKSRFGNAHVPIDFVDNPVLGVWLDEQKRLSRDGKLPSKQQTQLQLMGIIGDDTEKSPLNKNDKNECPPLELESDVGGKESLSSILKPESRRKVTGNEKDKGDTEKGPSQLSKRVEAEDATLPSLKRKRGRPRKTPEEKNGKSQPANESDVLGEQLSLTQNRKRGRKRKTSEEEDKKSTGTNAKEQVEKPPLRRKRKSSDEKSFPGHVASKEGKTSQVQDKKVTFDPLESYEKVWLKRYQELLAYKALHGSCNVPDNWMVNAALSSWVGTQRKKYELNGLSDDHYDKLVEAGFDFCPDRTKVTGKEIIASEDEETREETYELVPELKVPLLEPPTIDDMV